MPQHKLPSMLKMVSPARNSIEDLADIVTSGELSDALRMYNEVKREAERTDQGQILIENASTAPEVVIETEKSQQTVCLYNFSCSLCNEIFENQDDLTSHNCLHDPNVNVMYECQECRTLFQSLDALAQHMKTHEENVLVITGSTRMNKRSPASKTPHVGYMCSICDKVLSSKGSVIKHMELHKGLKPYVCNFCEKSFSIKGNRNKHELIHAGEKPHKCNICMKMFTFKGNLKKHLLTHTNFKGYKCELCDKDFTLKGNLDKHMKRHEKGLRRKGKVKIVDLIQVNLDDHDEMEEKAELNQLAENNGQSTEQLESNVIDITRAQGGKLMVPGGFNVNVKIIESSVKQAEINESVEAISAELEMEDKAELDQVAENNGQSTEQLESNVKDISREQGGKLMVPGASNGNVKGIDSSAEQTEINESVDNVSGEVKKDN